MITFNVERKIIKANPLCRKAINSSFTEDIFNTVKFVIIDGMVTKSTCMNKRITTIIQFVFIIQINSHQIHWIVIIDGIYIVHSESPMTPIKS